MYGAAIGVGREIGCAAERVGVQPRERATETPSKPNDLVREAVSCDHYDAVVRRRM